MPWAPARLPGSFLLPGLVRPRPACPAVALLHEDTGRPGGGGGICAAQEIKLGAMLYIIPPSFTSVYLYTLFEAHLCGGATDRPRGLGPRGKKVVGEWWASREATGDS